MYHWDMSSLSDRFRDKTRDTLAEALSALGVPAEMADRDRPEEKLGRRMFARSLGIIDIAEGPIAWVNVIKQDGSDKSPPQWWFVFGIPDGRKMPNEGAIKLTTLRKKSFPIFGQVLDVTWRGKDMGTGLISVLSEDATVDELVKRVKDMTLQSRSQEFQGWSLQTGKNFELSPADWEALQTIAYYVTIAPVG